MKVYVILLVLTTATLALAKKNKCSGTGHLVQQFNRRKEETQMPCKYNAVHQQCGSYMVTLTPGNIYLHPKYRLDSLWLGIKELGGKQRFWGGRTDNKIAVKFMNGWKNDLFVQKQGRLSTSSLLRFKKNSKETWAEARNGDFRVTFKPWDPESKTFVQSQWKFECFSKSFTPSGYPEQLCGGEEKQEVADRVEALGLESRDQVIYYDILTNRDITQTNDKCSNATRLMTRVCTEAQRRLAMITCSQILSSYQHTKCVTKYSCDPMDVFVDCIDWVCSDFADDHACERVGKSIDMCRNFNRGNLTNKVKAANCHKDFMPIL